MEKFEGICFVLLMLNNEYFNQHILLQRLQFPVLLPSSCPNGLTLHGGCHNL